MSLLIKTILMKKLLKAKKMSKNLINPWSFRTPPEKGKNLPKRFKGLIKYLNPKTKFNLQTCSIKSIKFNLKPKTHQICYLNFKIWSLKTQLWTRTRNNKCWCNCNLWQFNSLWSPSNRVSHQEWIKLPTFRGKGKDKVWVTIGISTTIIKKAFKIKSKRKILEILIKKMCNKKLPKMQIRKR
jgi:hypothetical protein